MFNFSILEVSVRHPSANAPIILGGFDMQPLWWYVFIAIYMLLSACIFAILAANKQGTAQASAREDIYQVYSVSICASKDAKGDPCWYATSLNIENVVGTGDSPAEAVDNLLSQVDKQKVFEGFCATKEEDDACDE